MRRQQDLIVGQGVVQTVHAVPGQRLAGQHAGAARRADGGVHVAALKQHAARGQTVQGRRGDGATAVTAERVPALLVAHDGQDVGEMLGRVPSIGGEPAAVPRWCQSVPSSTLIHPAPAIISARATCT